MERWRMKRAEGQIIISRKKSGFSERNISRLLLPISLFFSFFLHHFCVIFFPSHFFWYSVPFLPHFFSSLPYIWFSLPLFFLSFWSLFFFLSLSFSSKLCWWSWRYFLGWFPRHDSRFETSSFSSFFNEFFQDFFSSYRIAIHTHNHVLSSSLRIFSRKNILSQNFLVHFPLFQFFPSFQNPSLESIIFSLLLELLSENGSSSLFRTFSDPFSHFTNDFFRNFPINLVTLKCLKTWKICLNLWKFRPTKPKTAIFQPLFEISKERSKIISQNLQKYRNNRLIGNPDPPFRFSERIFRFWSELYLLSLFSLSLSLSRKKERKEEYSLSLILCIWKEVELVSSYNRSYSFFPFANFVDIFYLTDHSLFFLILPSSFWKEKETEKREGKREKEEKEREKTFGELNQMRCHFKLFWDVVEEKGNEDIFRLKRKREIILGKKRKNISRERERGGGRIEESSVTCQDEFEIYLGKIFISLLFISSISLLFFLPFLFLFLLFLFPSQKFSSLTQ